MKSVVKRHDAFLPPLPNSDRIVINPEKIWAFALDPFNIEKAIEKQKSRSDWADEKATLLRRGWAARVGLFKEAGFSLRPSATSSIDTAPSLRESTQDIIEKISTAVKQAPAIIKEDEHGIPCADVKVKLRGPKASLGVITGWKYQDLTSLERTDIPRLITIIPIGLLRQDRSHQDDNT